MSNPQRKYIDLIFHACSRWANWNPPIPIEVGTYGKIEHGTGDLRVHGNIYRPEFQIELDKLGIPLRITDHPVQETATEQDFITASKGAKCLDAHLVLDVGFAGLANASLKTQWQFERGKRGALLAMYNPRIKYLPDDVILDKLYEVPMLKDMVLVTRVHVCPAYSMYLSNKSGEKATFALVAQAPVAAIAGITAGGDGGLSWWSDAQADLIRKACDKAGGYKYTPLYELKRQAGLLQRLFREEHQPADLPSGDDLWVDVTVPWDPLNEDGEEDSLEVQEEDADEF